MSNELVSQAEQSTAVTNAKAGEILRVVEVCPLTNPAEEAQAAALLTHLKGLIKSVEAERKGLIGPMDKVVRKVNALYRAPRKELERVEALLKKRLGEAQAAREEARAKALAQVAQSTESGDTEGAQAALDTARDQEHGGHQGISYRDDWEIMLVNAHAVPREFMSVDVAKIRDFLKANPDGQVNGCQIKRVKKVVARAS